MCLTLPIIQTGAPIVSESIEEDHTTPAVVPDIFDADANVVASAAVGEIEEPKHQTEEEAVVQAPDSVIGEEGVLEPPAQLEEIPAEEVDDVKAPIHDIAIVEEKEDGGLENRVEEATIDQPPEPVIDHPAEDTLVLDAPVPIVTIPVEEDKPVAKFGGPDISQDLRPVIDGNELHGQCSELPLLEQ